MAKQLAHLLTVTGKPSVTVRVIRLAVVRPVLSPSFTLLMLPDAADTGIACLEGIGGQIDISKRPAEIDTIRNMFEALTESALSPASSAELISRYAGSFS